MTRFSENAWQANLPLFEKTRDMPFNRELAEGSLPEEKFRHYMIQDAHYLEGFARGTFAGCCQGLEADHVVQFAKAAEVAIIVERELHAEYFERFGVTPESFEGRRAQPGLQSLCELPQSHLRARAVRSRARRASAVFLDLP